MRVPAMPSPGPRAYELATILILAAVLGSWWSGKTTSTLLPSPETPAMTSATKATPLTADSFRELTVSSDQPVLVDFWAPWCPPCRGMAPTLDALAAAYDGRAQVVKLDIDEHPQIAEQLGVSSIPTFVLFKGGKEVQRFVGAKAYPELAAALEEQIDV